MKVLMVGPDRSVHGGISGVVNNYYEAGLDQKIDLTYIGTMVEGSKLRKLLKAAEAYMRFCMKLPKNQIVHINMASDSSYYRKSVFIRTAKKFGKKVVIHQHGGDFQTFYREQLSDKGRRRLRETLAMADTFLVLAPVWKEFFSQIIDEEKIIVLPNAVEIPKLKDKHYGQHKILFLGRICREKGIQELLDVFLELTQEYSDLHLYLGGVWEDAGLKKIAEEHDKQITYLGWVTGEEKRKCLKMCDVFVLPSYFEGQPVSVLEAMAAGCGVIASGVGGIPSMIADGKTGILTEPRNEESLRQGLLQVLRDAEFCRKLGQNARQKVEREFSIEKNIENLIDIYRKELKLS